MSTIEYGDLVALCDMCHYLIHPETTMKQMADKPFYLFAIFGFAQNLANFLNLAVYPGYCQNQQQVEGKSCIDNNSGVHGYISYFEMPRTMTLRIL